MTPDSTMPHKNTGDLCIINLKWKLLLLNTAELHHANPLNFTGSLHVTTDPCCDI